MGSDTLLCESNKNRPFRKWESPSPVPSISVAIYHTCRIDAKMHKSQVCTIPINSIMGSVEAEPLKNHCFQGFSLVLVKIICSKLIQNVKHSRQAPKRFNTESLSARSEQRERDSISNRCYEAADCIRFTDCIQFIKLSSSIALHHPTTQAHNGTIRKTSMKLQDIDV